MYKILRTDRAEDQLRDIIFYIADDSGNIDLALNYLDEIEESINRLQEFPNAGSIPRYSILKKQGYRVIIVERHLVFYKVNEEDKIVIIYAIVDGRREYKNLTGTARTRGQNKDKGTGLLSSQGEYSQAN